MTLPVIIGGGLAGLSAALALAPYPVVVLGRKASSGLTSSELAQGGIAAVVASDDSLALHEQDTLAAGAGLCDPAIVRQIIGAGPQAIERLRAWGVVFDCDEGHRLKTGLEGAHSRKRIVHANGDATGDAVMRGVLNRVRQTPSITFIEGGEVLALKRDPDGLCGVVFRQDGTGIVQEIVTRAAVLATGSACALWEHTTVPPASWGHGLLLASEAGASLRDLEFVQFHPTALASSLDPMPLISEALRGAGARLVTERGESFVGELNPRDIVARAIWDQQAHGHTVYLDARHLDDFDSRFPTILQACLKGGLDPRERWIPIRPVAHYHMGGIATDGQGKTDVAGLWACGECACTGLHGANRLASNSLLEAVVMGCRVGDSLRACATQQTPFTMQSCALEFSDQRESPKDRARVRAVMSSCVGLRRQARDLGHAVDVLAEMAHENRLARVGLLIAKAALARQESCGAHDRSDFPV